MHSDRVSFRNYFWTAQLIAGTTMAIKLYPVGAGAGGGVPLGVIAALFGFIAASPLCAALARV